MNKLSSTFQKFSIVLPIILILITCDSNRSWSNPNDPDTDLDPSEWAPSNLQAIVLNDAEIKLTWEQKEKRISGFRLERSTGSDFTDIVELDADVTEYTDTGLSLNTDYTYRIQAFTEDNESEYSNTTETTLFYDCAGEFMGTAIEDCAGDCNGTAIENICDECVGGNTGLDENYCDTVTDIDGNEYETVIIGGQVWTTTNLKTTHYRNGDAIPTGYSASEWGNLSTGAYAVYNDDESNADTYGYLYNWYAVDDSRNIAPEGLHVPTDDEWKELEMHLGMSQSEADDTGWRGTNEGSKLAGRADLWSNWSLENNAEFGTSGFTALPGGYRAIYGGSYDGMGTNGDYWSSTEGSSSNAWYRGLYYLYSDVYRHYLGKRNGWSVRCIRD